MKGSQMQEQSEETLGDLNFIFIGMMEMVRNLQPDVEAAYKVSPSNFAETRSKIERILAIADEGKAA